MNLLDAALRDLSACIRDARGDSLKPAATAELKLHAQHIGDLVAIERRALLALAHQYASECGDCAGMRITPNGRGGDEPCTECADIWAVIERVEGRSI